MYMVYIVYRFTTGQSELSSGQAFRGVLAGLQGRIRSLEIRRPGLPPYAATGETVS